MSAQNERRVSTSERFAVGDFKHLNRVQTMEPDNEKKELKKMFDLPESSDGGAAQDIHKITEKTESSKYTITE